MKRAQMSIYVKRGLFSEKNIEATKWHNNIPTKRFGQGFVASYMATDNHTPPPR